LTKEEYQKILDIWEARYEIQLEGDKKAHYRIREYSRTISRFTFTYGLHACSQMEVSLEQAEGLAKNNASNEEVFQTILAYATIQTLKTIGFDVEKFTDLCRVTNYGNNLRH